MLPDCRPCMWTPPAVAPAPGVLDMDAASSVRRHIGPPPLGLPNANSGHVYFQLTNKTQDSDSSVRLQKIKNF